MRLAQQLNGRFARQIPIFFLLSCSFLFFLFGSDVFAAQSPFGVAIPDSTGPIATGGLWGDIQGWILARQSEFYLALQGAVKEIQNKDSALWLLIGLSFGYGVFHAAGPGHGKVVLTTYLFASGATARKGAVLALIAAMVQASVAVILIGIAAVALNLTAMAITQTAQLLELASYALFVVLGGWLLLRAWRAFQVALGWNKASGHSHHDHGDEEAHRHHHHSHEHEDGPHHNHGSDHQAQAHHIHHEPP